jgi:hypothetical protein
MMKKLSMTVQTCLKREEHSLDHHHLYDLADVDDSLTWQKSKKLMKEDLLNHHHLTEIDDAENFEVTDAILLKKSPANQMTATPNCGFRKDSVELIWQRIQHC